MATNPASTAAATAREIVERIGEWQAFHDLAGSAPGVEHEAARRFDAENLQRHAGLLDVVEPERPAERHAKRAHAQSRAVDALLHSCREAPVYRWLCSLDGYSKAERRILRGQARDSARVLTWLRVVSASLPRWAVLRSGVDRGMAIRMRLTKKEMREAASIADDLRGALSSVVETGSELASTFYTAGFGLGARSYSLQGLLERLSRELRESANKRGNVGRNDDTAIDRWLMRDLHAELQDALGEVDASVVELLCTAVGIERHRSNVQRALK